MPRALSVIAAIWAFTFSHNVIAQDALDRVDPARIEDRKVDTLRPQFEAPPAIQPAEAASPTDNHAVVVGAIELVGLDHIPRSQFSGVIEPYLGRTLTREDLAALTDRIAERARATFPLTSAVIEPQTMRAGILRIRVDEGRIDAIMLEGYRSDALLASLRRLVTGKPVRAGELETQLLIAGDIDGVTIEKARVLRESGHNNLIVDATYRRVRSQLSLDNDSTKPIGPLEVFGSVSLNGVLSDNDSLQVFGLGALPKIDELAFIRLRYAARISSGGTEVSIAGSFSQTMPGSYLEPLRISGKSRWASVGIMQPLARSPHASAWIEASVSYRRIRQDRSDQLAREDRLTVAKLRVFGSARFAGGTVRSNATVSQGLDLFDATRAGDPLSSRPDADGTYTGLWLSTQWSRTIAPSFSVDLGVRSQLVTQPVLVSEEIGLGGAAFARGYDYSERSGDKGTMGYIELRYKIARKVGPVRGVELYTFGDGGMVRNLAGGFGGGSLFSTGAGLRADVDRRTDASLEVAVPLSEARYDTGNHAPRIRFSLTRYF